jgi:hypothetical protein
MELLIQEGAMVDYMVEVEVIILDMVDQEVQEEAEAPGIILIRTLADQE